MSLRTPHHMFRAIILILIVPSVNPLYYVTFTTATLCASFILFSGFNTTDAINTISLICGFLVTFTGVYLLNLSRTDPSGTKSLAPRRTGDATGTDMISSIQTRISMENARRSLGHHSRGHSIGSDRAGLIQAYDEEEAAGFGLTDLAEESDEDSDDPRSPMIGSHHHQANGRPNGNGMAKGFAEPIELQARKGSP